MPWFKSGCEESTLTSGYLRLCVIILITMPSMDDYFSAKRRIGWLTNENSEPNKAAVVFAQIPKAEIFKNSTSEREGQTRAARR